MTLVTVPRNWAQTAQPLNWAADDTRRIAVLHESGRRTDGKLAVLWTPQGALNDAESAQLIERLDKGVAALRAIIGTHPWQFVQDQRIVFYVSDDQFAAHNNGDETVMIPLVRLRDGRAPFLHEAAHSLTSRVRPTQPLDAATIERVRAARPLWLIEGIADYLAQSAAKAAAVQEGDVFNSGGFDGVDMTCAARLRTPEGQIIAEFIGSLGAPEGLFTTDRPRFAPPFYACAFSYTKYLAGLIGVQELIGLMDLYSTVDRSSQPPRIGPDRVLPRIEKLTGKSAATVRTEWLKQINGER